MIGRLVQGLRSTLLLVSPSAPARPGRDPVREALLVQFIGLLRAATPPGHPRPRPGAPGVGFGLCVDKSTIEGAERGLFLARGAAEQGAAVVVYPGRVHLALPPLTQRLQIEGVQLEDHSAELAGSDKVIGLPDGGCLDGAVADTPALLPIMTQFTRGHIVNHAPNAAAVNCKLAGLDVHPSTLPLDIRDRRAPGPLHVFPHAVCLSIAWLRTVEGRRERGRRERREIKREREREEREERTA